MNRVLRPLVLTAAIGILAIGVYVLILPLFILSY
jgi:hypothetical protein